MAGPPPTQRPLGEEEQERRWKSKGACSPCTPPSLGEKAGVEREAQRCSISSSTVR